MPSGPAAPSVFDYVEAFRSILPSLSEPHLAMLRAHYSAPERSLTAAELSEAAIESERAAAATEAEDESELAEVVDEFGDESVLPETIGEDAAELGGDSAGDARADATNREYGAIGQAMFEQLPAFLKQCKRRHKGGTFDHIDALAETQDRSGSRETWVWSMRPQVAAALEELGLTARD